MNNKWRNLLGIVAIIVLAGIGYFFFSSPAQEPNFNQTYSNLSSAWINEGLDQPALHSNFEELLELPASKLNAIKLNLQQSITSQSETDSKDLVALYSELIDIAIISKGINQKADSLESSSDTLCSLFPEYKELDSQMQELSDRLLALSQNVTKFTENYPTQSAEIELFNLGGRVITYKENMQSQAAVISLLESECE